MRPKSAKSSSAPRSRLTHGLTSKWHADLRREKVETLALDLMVGAPSKLEILETARALAHEMVCVEATRTEKWRGFNSDALRHLLEGSRRDIRVKGGARSEDRQDPSDPGHVDMPDAFTILSQAARYLRRLDELERKAMSRRNRLLTRLDLLILDEGCKRMQRMAGSR